MAAKPTFANAGFVLMLTDALCEYMPLALAEMVVDEAVTAASDSLAAAGVQEDAAAELMWFIQGPLRDALANWTNARTAAGVLWSLAPMVENVTSGVHRRREKLSPVAHTRRARSALVVSADGSMLRVLSDALAQDGFAVQAARDAATAVGVALKVRPCVVVSDYELPGINGGRLAALLERTMGANRPPVVLCTSDPDLLLPRATDRLLLKPLEMSNFRVVRTKRSRLAPSMISAM